MQSKAIKDREDRLRMLLDNAGDAIYLARADGTLVDVNSEAVRQTGFSREELLSMSVYDVDANETRESFGQFAGRTSPPSGTLESRHRRKDGGSFPVEIRVAFIEESGGGLLIFGVARDISERKRAEDELKRSEEKFRTIADFTHDWEYWVGPDGRFIWCSPSCERITGWPAEQFLNDPGLFLRMLHPEDVPAYAAHAEATAFVGSPPCDLDLRIITRSGETIWINHVCLPVLAPDGTYRGRRGCNRDITERKLGEENLRQNRMMLANIINTVPQAVFWKDKNSVYLGCNETFARYAGVASPEQVIGKTDYDFPWLPEESDSYRADDRAVMDGNLSKRHIIEQLMQTDGTRIWLDTSKVPLADASGRVQGVLGIFEDITERKKTQEELAASERRLADILSWKESIINNTAVGLLVVTKGRVITEVNKGFVDMFGYSPEELIGQSVSMIHVSQDSFVEFGERHWSATSMRKVVTAQWRMRRKSGEIFWCELTGSAIDSRDIWLGVVWVIVDISERIRLQEAIIQSEKMMSVGGLAAGMAHEINNPLGGILQSSQVLASRLGEELPANLAAAEKAGCDFSGMRAYMEERGVFPLLGGIRDSASRAARIVANMLAFCRRSNSSFIPEDVNAIIENTLDLASSDYDLMKKYDFRAIRIEKDLDPALPLVKVSPMEIGQVILNLLKNAAYALSEGGGHGPGREPPTISLRTRHENGRVFIEVEDNGPGMSPEVARHAFEPFFTTKQTGVGTGLGLSVAYFIVTSHHGGNISLETAPGKGARFMIELPA